MIACCSSVISLYAAVSTAMSPALGRGRKGPKDIPSGCLPGTCRRPPWRTRRPPLFLIQTSRARPSLRPERPLLAQSWAERTTYIPMNFKPITGMLVMVLAALALAPAASAAGLAHGVSHQKALSTQKSLAKPQRGAEASALIAPDAACPDQSRTAAPATVQEQAMRCLFDFARVNSGLPPLAEVEQLAWSAQAKTGDLIRCDSFSHFACERPFSYWIRESGYLDPPCW